MIHLKSVYKKIGHNWILKNINLRINENDFIVITGSNGSGKTTLFNIIAGILKPTKGEVIYLRKIRKNIVFQENLFSDFFTPFSALKFFKDLTRAEGDIKKALNIVSVNTKKPLYKLSPGLRRRVELAKIFLHDADIIMLDEPFSHVDIKHKNKILQALLSLNKTMIIISNDLNIIKKAKKLILISNGRISFNGSPKNIDYKKLKERIK